MKQTKTSFQGMKTQALLALEDGTTFRGYSFGAHGEFSGEIVFNTSMCGYTEILTDPSYRGQMVCMTYPLIGNYGVSTEDFESRGPCLSGFVVKECSRIPSSWRSESALPRFLEESGIPGIEGIDTRRLVRHIREFGAMKAVISTIDLNETSLVEKAKCSPGLVGRDCVKEVTTANLYKWDTSLSEAQNREKRFSVVAIDFGVKHNILRSLVSAGCAVSVVPATTPAAQILAMNPDGVFLSNGPGDPAALGYIIKEVRELIKNKPVFGVCLGHQLIAHAVGADTYKLKFGHHGANHPVKNLATQKVEITSQNHGFAVSESSLKNLPLQITHVNLNDHTIEGFAHTELPVFSVQYHPEAAPGPHDSARLFDVFTEIMTSQKPASRFFQD